MKKKTRNVLFIYCLCYVTVLDHFFFESIFCSKTRLSYSVCLLNDCIHDVFPLTQATLIKNEFMTLIFVCVIFEQALQKRMCAL
jgi:hypothetical protein